MESGGAGVANGFQSAVRPLTKTSRVCFGGAGSLATLSCCCRCCVCWAGSRWRSEPEESWARGAQASSPRSGSTRRRRPASSSAWSTPVAAGAARAQVLAPAGGESPAPAPVRGDAAADLNLVGAGWPIVGTRAQVWRRTCTGRETCPRNVPAPGRFPSVRPRCEPRTRCRELEAGATRIHPAHAEDRLVYNGADWDSRTGESRVRGNPWHRRI